MRVLHKYHIDWECHFIINFISFLSYLLSTHGPCCTGISTLEQWYLLFSFLSITANTTLGRPYAWKAVQFLIENNAINDMNFTPCRHLILRFLNWWAFISFLLFLRIYAIHHISFIYKSNWYVLNYFHFYKSDYYFLSELSVTVNLTFDIFIRLYETIQSCRLLILLHY